ATHPSLRVPLSLHDALPIFLNGRGRLLYLSGELPAVLPEHVLDFGVVRFVAVPLSGSACWVAVDQNVLVLVVAKLLHKLLRRLRSEEHTSELQSRFDLVCRL